MWNAYRFQIYYLKASFFLKLWNFLIVDDTGYGWVLTSLCCWAVNRYYNRTARSLRHVSIRPPTLAVGLGDPTKGWKSPWFSRRVRNARDLSALKARLSPMTNCGRATTFVSIASSEPYLPLSLWSSSNIKILEIYSKWISSRVTGKNYLSLLQIFNLENFLLPETSRENICLL